MSLAVHILPRSFEVGYLCHWQCIYCQGLWKLDIYVIGSGYTLKVFGSRIAMSLAVDILSRSLEVGYLCHW
jgi:hypothetical protein